MKLKTRQAAKITACGKQFTIIQRYDETGLYTDFVVYFHSFVPTDHGVMQRRRQYGKDNSMWQALSYVAAEY